MRPHAVETPAIEASSGASPTPTPVRTTPWPRVTDRPSAKTSISLAVKSVLSTDDDAHSSTDTGPVIVQAIVPVLPGDGEEDLARRILEQEHRIYPQAIHWFAEGRLSVEGRKVRLAGARAPAGAAQTNPPVELG